jgi:hypothetical protein
MQIRLHSRLHLELELKVWLVMHLLYPHLTRITEIVPSTAQFLSQI